MYKEDGLLGVIAQGRSYILSIQPAVYIINLFFYEIDSTTFFNFSRISMVKGSSSSPLSTHS